MHEIILGFSYRIIWLELEVFLLTVMQAALDGLKFSIISYIMRDRTISWLPFLSSICFLCYMTRLRLKELFQKAQVNQRISRQRRYLLVGFHHQYLKVCLQVKELFSWFFSK